MKVPVPGVQTSQVVSSCREEADAVWPLKKPRRCTAEKPDFQDIYFTFIELQALAAEAGARTRKT